jgi:hypothetical protein
MATNTRSGNVVPFEVLKRVRASKKFRNWKPSKAYFAEIDRIEIGKEPYTLTKEDHFSPAYWAKKWGVSAETIRTLFRHEPGVLKLKDRKTTRYKRGYVSLRIPVSVAERVHKRLCQEDAA